MDGSLVLPALWQSFTILPAGGLGLVVMGGKKVMNCRQLGQDSIQEAVLSRSSSWRFAPENGFYLFWSDWRSIVGDSRRSDFREPVEL